MNHRATYCLEGKTAPAQVTSAPEAEPAPLPSRVRRSQAGEILTRLPLATGSSVVVIGQPLQYPDKVVFAMVLRSGYSSRKDCDVRIAVDGTRIVLP